MQQLKPIFCTFPHCFPQTKLLDLFQSQIMANHSFVVYPIGLPEPIRLQDIAGASGPARLTLVPLENGFGQRLPVGFRKCLVIAFPAFLFRIFGEIMQISRELVWKWAHDFFSIMFMPKTRKGSPLEMGWCGVRPAKNVQVHTCVMPRSKREKNFGGTPNKTNLFSRVFLSEIRWTDTLPESHRNLLEASLNLTAPRPSGTFRTFSRTQRTNKHT